MNVTIETLITAKKQYIIDHIMPSDLDSDIKEIRIFSRDEKKQDDMRHHLQAQYPEQAAKVKFYIGDVRNRRSIDIAMRGGVDYIFSAAELDPLLRAAAEAE